MIKKYCLKILLLMGYAVKSPAYMLKMFFLIVLFFSFYSNPLITMHQPLAEASKMMVYRSFALSPKKDFPPDYYGFNTNILGGPAWQDQSFIHVINKFNPLLMRYPGGTVANYWDWKKGFVMDNLPEDTPLGLKNIKMKVSATLDEFKIASDQSGFTPVFVLNMETSSLDYQMEMLRYAKAIGLKVQYIELGNEFYFQHTRQLRKNFPSGKAYAEISHQWAMRIKEEFPDALIAVHGLIDPRSATERPRNRVMEEWNLSMKETVENSQWIDAIALHIYIPNTIKTEDELTNSNSLQEIISQSYLGLESLKQTIPKLPTNKKIWITEFNLMDQHQTIHSRWIHGVSVGLQLLSYFEIQEIEMILYHSLIGRSDFTAFFKDSDGLYYGYPELKSKPWSLSATGVVLKEIFNSMRDAEKFQAIGLHCIDFNSSLDHDILAYRFEQGFTQNLVIINPSPKMIHFKPPWIKPNQQWIQRGVHADPYMVISNDEKNIEQTILKASSLYQIQPFSINVFVNEPYP